MFRIGEFSKLTQVSVRMLRYYDETGILSRQRLTSGRDTGCIRWIKYHWNTIPI